MSYFGILQNVDISAGAEGGIRMMANSGRWKSGWGEEGRIKTYADCLPPTTGTTSFLSGLRHRKEQPKDEGMVKEFAKLECEMKRKTPGNPALALFGSKMGVPLSYGTLGPKGTDAAECPATDVYWHYNPGPQIYSRKVFVGGLPMEVGEVEIQLAFGRFGKVVVDWPYKRPTPLRYSFPNKSTGYAFLVFESHQAVVAVVAACLREEGDRLYMCVGNRDKAVQVRPWRLADSDFLVNQTRALSPRYTVFVGAVPRPMKAVELAHAINKLYGGVGYAGIDTDTEYGYPRGSGRVVFWSEDSYLGAIRSRYVALGVGEMEKRVEMKPYVMDGQRCSICGGPAAALFCPHPPCLAYYCEDCFSPSHASSLALAQHQPAVRDSARHRLPPQPNSRY